MGIPYFHFQFISLIEQEQTENENDIPIKDDTVAGN